MHDVDEDSRDQEYSNDPSDKETQVAQGVELTLFKLLGEVVSEQEGEVEV